MRAAENTSGETLQADALHFAPVTLFAATATSPFIMSPQPERLLEGQDAGPDLSAAVTEALVTLSQRFPRLSEIHNVRLREKGEGLFLHYHCRCVPGQTIERIQIDVDQFEAGLMERFRRIRRIIAHAETLGARQHTL